jgi:hypothetical protein
VVLMNGLLKHIDKRRWCNCHVIWDGCGGSLRYENIGESVTPINHDVNRCCGHNIY